MIEIAFWLSLWTVAYIYVGYPLFARALAAAIGKRVCKSAEYLPSVTVVTAAHNEAAHIAATIENKLRQDYPPHLLEMIVVSDASTDGTDDLVRACRERVRLIRQEPRGGKTAALSAAIQRAKGELVVFSDANSIYAPQTIRRMAANFADPEVGYVTGKMIYTNPDGSLVGDGCSAYMKYENFLRAAETQLGSVIGVDGGVDAVRRSLYVPMRPDQQPDLVLPLCIAEAGYRVVYESDALLQENVLSTTASEYSMRVRVSLRALWALWDKRSLLNPLRHPLLAWQILSHKVLRYLAFIPLASLFVTALLLAPSGTLFAGAAAAQVIGYGLAWFGWRNPTRRSQLFGFPFYFALLNLASAHAMLKFLAGDKQTTWAPRTG